MKLSSTNFLCLVSGVLLILVSSINAEYEWNGKEWIWKETPTVSIRSIRILAHHYQISQSFNDFETLGNEFNQFLQLQNAAEGSGDYVDEDVNEDSYRSSDDDEDDDEDYYEGSGDDTSYVPQNNNPPSSSNTGNTNLNNYDSNNNGGSRNNVQITPAPDVRI